MFVKTKKLITAIIIAITLAALSVALFLYARTDTGADAYAEGSGGWTPYVKYRKSEGTDVSLNFTDMGAQPVVLEANTEINCFVRITDPELTVRNTYYYYASDSKLNTVGEKNSVSWKTIYSSGHSTSDFGTSTVTEDGISVTYYWLPAETFPGCYVYFRRVQTVFDGGIERTIIDDYPAPIELNYSISTGVAPKIDAVSATCNNAPYRGTWTASPIRFTVTTSLMSGGQEYDRTKELLSYSVDGENFIPFGKDNSVEIKDRALNNVPVIFRVTDISGGNPDTWVYGDEPLGHPNEYNVHMDPYRPEFSVSAETVDLAGNRVEYINGSWTSRPVSFSLQNISNCCSTINYSFTGSDGQVKDMQGLTVTSFENTTPSIRFRATNQAGTTFEYSTVFNVNIDSSRPNVSLSAATTDPDDSAKKKQLSSSVDGNGTVSFGFANGNIELYVYNRLASGTAINNASGTKFEYQEKTNGIYTGNWRTMTTQVRTTDGRETGYVLTASTTDVVYVSRTFKFRISSNAGLVSEEREATFTLIKSAYLIELGEINAEINDLGWIADYAAVTVSVPTDSVKSVDGTYTKPTMEYKFFYQAANSSIVNSAIGLPVSVHEEKDGTVRWWYEFKLVASADSPFLIYAQNSAGKNSANTETTDRIQIDVLPPEYQVSAYIHPTTEIPIDSYLYIDDIRNPGWINGQIILTLRVKVGVSGVYVKEMIYSKENGVILRDEYTGEIIWQPRSQEMAMTDSIEDPTTGVKWQIYTISIDVKEETSGDQQFYIGSKEYKWRVYTKSGKYVDVDFTANIDTSSTVALAGFNMTSGHKSINVTIPGGSGQRYIDMSASDRNFSVCETTNVSFSSSLDRAGIADHYVIRYQFFDGDGMLPDRLLTYAETLGDNNFVTLSAGANLPIAIPTNSAGDIYVAIFIRSTARDYAGVVIGAGPYVVKLHYDTVNLSINYQIEASNGTTDVTAEMQAGEWVKGRIFVTVSVKTNENGGQKIDSSYTFWYMELKSIASGIPDVGWVQVDNGMLTENERDTNYEFTLPFENRSYYGYLAVSVCNGAGYRSKQEAASVIAIKIDNTTPDIDEAIIYPEISSDSFAEGIRADESTMTVGGDVVNVLTYYATNEINLQRVTDEGRSAITFYYKPITDAEITKLTYNKNELRVLGNTQTGIFSEANITLTGSNYQTVYYLIYAVNSVGTEAPGANAQLSNNILFHTVYRFVYDPSSIEGTISYDNSSGIYSEQTGMFTYLWKEEIHIFVSGRGSYAPIGEEEYILYQFSVDNGITWFDYLYFGSEVWYTSGEDVTLTFSPDLLRDYVVRSSSGAIIDRPFQNGANCVFTFRSRNKAGATKIYDNVYIAMEDTVPDFTVTLLDQNNSNYYGGVADFKDEVTKWASGPVTINIETTVMPSSGITYMYYLQYFNGSSLVTTRATENEDDFGKKLTNYTSFSTDTLDGFNLNRDAILYITAFSNSSTANHKQVKVRIAVDQVVPEFTLTGQAFQQHSSITQLISSGQWTNKNTVSISKSTNVQNVSEVTYEYSIQYKDSTSAATAKVEWMNNVGSIDVTESCVFTVTATTRSQLTYTKEFIVNIDTTAPKILFEGGMNIIEGEEYFIDVRGYVEEANIEICEYITIKEEKRGFAFNPNGYTFSTSSVDNSTRYEKTTGEPYRGYVKIYVKDYAGNEASIWFYILPFRLTVNNLTLTDEDLAQVDEYEKCLNKARTYMTESRVGYFENLISRLNDRENTLRKEIAGYQDYLEKLYSRTSFELRSDYAEMYSYMETYNNYALYGQAWIQTAIKGDSTSKYYTYFLNFQTQFEKLRGLMDEVETIQQHVTELPAINMVERKDYDNIINVYYEYMNLTQDQQACFTPNLLNKLKALKESCEVLLLVDEELGVAIDGDFAPGATINVTVFDSTTETFNNAQSLLAETVSDKLPRTVVSVHRIMLDDAYAQTTASDIVITLPIDEDYRDYINFSVYELSEDGTVKPIKNTKIQPDGTCIKFKADSLSTYVLCVKSELEKTDTTEGTYGTLLGLELDTKMISYLIYIGAALFGIVLLVVIIGAIRRRRFFNSYNRAYRHSLYKKRVKGIPKGNKGV